ncbi:MAG: EAL domain-containing protein [Pseudomonadales bacterium]|nr:EAL domain-containing protein [Pseudomonadales bacterium]
MRTTPVREIDLQLWAPLAAVALFVIATLAWLAVDYPTRVRQVQAQTLAQWSSDLLRLQQLLDKVDRDDLLTSYNDRPGLRYLALLDTQGRILHANRLAARGQGASSAFTGFDSAILEPTTAARGGLAIGPDGHLRGHYPAVIGDPRDQLRPPANALLYVDVDTAGLVASIRGDLLRQTAIFAGILVTALLGGILFTRRYVNRPIKILAEGVLAYRPGESFEPIPLVGGGPLSRLAREFERTAQALNDGIAEIVSRGERLDRILESIGDGVIITDADGRVERLNQVAEELTGWSRDAARGQRIDEIFAPFDNTNLQPLPNPVLQTLETETAVELAIHAAIQSRTGQVYQIADTTSPIRNADGMVEGAVLVFQDVTEAYQLREQQRIAAVAFDTAAPQLIADRAGRVIRVNQACLDLGGYSREEMLGFHLVRDVFIGQESPGLGEFLAGRSVADVWSGPTWWRRKNGERVQLWVTDTIVRDAQGEIAHFVISAIDTTELEKAVTAAAETRDNYQRLIGSIQDGVAIIQNDTFVDCNAALAEMLGRSRAEILDRKVAELSLPHQAEGSDSAARALALFGEVVRHGDGHTDWHMVRADGESIVLEATLSKILWRGEPALLAVARDITERRAHEQVRQQLLGALERSERTMRLACSAYGIATWEIEIATGDVTWARGAEAALGVKRDQLPATLTQALALLAPEDRPSYATAVESAVAQGAGYSIEFDALLPNLGKRRFRSQGEVHRDEGGVRLYGATADVTAQHQAQEDIERLAFHDALTGLANRRLFLDRLQQALRQALRSGQWGAVLFVDLDRFKLLNDSLGHSAGDTLLREVALRCMDAVREADTVARLGGDEFVILVTNLGADAETATRHAHRIATKLRDRLGASYPLDAHDYHLTASIGIALFPRDGQDAEELLRHADVAMYQAKQGGRNDVTFYQPSLQTRADRRLSLERELRQAIDRGELCLHYQPKVDAAEIVIGAEALLRWQHPMRGMVPPLDFIPIAEETGLIYPIGKQVMHQVCAQLEQWRGRWPGRALSIAVNVSPHQFRHPEFIPCVAAAVAEHRVVADELIVEITEGVMLNRIDLVIARMRDLKALGVNLAVDDFGTGYSSLYYLKHLPLDEIKIDQSYVRDLLEDANDAAIVESIIAIARNLKLRTVAEGVETAAQADKLRTMGCVVHQGYFYARPLPLAEFEAFAGL